MEIALVDGRRSAPQPRLTGHCPVCGSIVIAKCGTQRTWHWSHKGERSCDPWWEETEWHVSWKSCFPQDWREIIHTALDGEKHIADVKLADGRVLEFQHSAISEEERQSREAFYGSMIWIVDGRRRKRDIQTFQTTLHQTSRDPLVYSGYKEDCALLRDWVGRPVHVVFDLGDRKEDVAAFGATVLWQLHPDPQGQVILTPIPKKVLIDMLHKGTALRHLRRTQAPAPRPIRRF